MSMHEMNFDNVIKALNIIETNEATREATAEALQSKAAVVAGFCLDVFSRDRVCAAMLGPYESSEIIKRTGSNIEFPYVSFQLRDQPQPGLYLVGRDDSPTDIEEHLSPSFTQQDTERQWEHKTLGPVERAHIISYTFEMSSPARVEDFSPNEVVALCNAFVSRLREARASIVREQGRDNELLREIDVLYKRITEGDTVERLQWKVTELETAVWRKQLEVENAYNKTKNGMKLAGPHIAGEIPVSQLSQETAAVTTPIETNDAFLDIWWSLMHAIPLEEPEVKVLRSAIRAVAKYTEKVITIQFIREATLKEWEELDIPNLGRNKINLLKQYLGVLPSVEDSEI